MARDKKGMRITRIHVNKHIIASNRIHGKNDAPLTCKVGKENIKAHELGIYVDGELVGSFVYRPDKPLNCGARVWFELKTGNGIEVKTLK